MYKYVIISFLLLLTQSTWLPKIVWTYWQEELEEDNHKLRIFTENHKRFLKKIGWEYHFVNNVTVMPWIKDMKEVVEALQRPQFRDQHVTRRSNLIRLALVKQYGGLWVDYSTFFADNLDWLDKLKQNPIAQNVYGNEPSVLMTYNSFAVPPGRAYDAQTKKSLLIDLRFQTSFIAAKPKSKILVEWLSAFIEGKRITEQKLKNNQKLADDCYMFQIAKDQKIQYGPYGSKYFQFELTLIVLLQRKQRQLDKAWQAGGRKGYRKFAVKQYNIWTLPFERSIFLASSNSYGVVSYLLREDRDQLKQNRLDTIYPVKTVGSQRGRLFFYIEEISETKAYCPEVAFINTKSIFYEHMLKDYPVKFSKNPHLDKYAAKLNIGLFCPNVVSWQRRQIVLEYTSNGLVTEINKLFQNVFNAYYVDVGVNDQSTLGLHTKGWNGVSIDYPSQNSTNKFIRESVKYLNMSIIYTNSSKIHQQKFTLRNICQKYYQRKITFLNIGQAGVQSLALLTSDWQNLKCRPDVIQIRDISNQANYLQHEAVLIQHNYELLEHYRLNQYHTVSHIFVTRQKLSYYQKRYKYTQARGQNEIGSLRLQAVSNITKEYLQANKKQFNITQDDNIPYYLSRAGLPLLISDIIDWKRSMNMNINMPVFVLGFDPINSDIVINGEYNSSRVQISYLRFLKLEVYNQQQRQQQNPHNIFILDPNKPPITRAKILTTSPSQLQLYQQLKANNKTKGTGSQSARAQTLTQNELMQSIIEQSVSEYRDLSFRAIVLYWVVIGFIIVLFGIFLFVINGKDEYSTTYAQRIQSNVLD